MKWKISYCFLKLNNKMTLHWSLRINLLKNQIPTVYLLNKSSITRTIPVSSIVKLTLHHLLIILKMLALLLELIKRTKIPGLRIKILKLLITITVAMIITSFNSIRNKGLMFKMETLMIWNHSAKKKRLNSNRFKLKDMSSK
jgi:hypothetical protein